MNQVEGLGLVQGGLTSNDRGYQIGDEGWGHGGGRL